MLNAGCAAGAAVFVAVCLARSAFASEAVTGAGDDAVPLACPGGGAAAAQPASGLVPLFRAAVRPTKARVGAPITVALTITNRGRAMLYLPDPLQGGESLHLRITSPTGEVHMLNVGKRPGGVWSRLVNIGVRPKSSETIRFDLREHAPVGDPGIYSVSLDYEWKSNEHWYSPELKLSVGPR